MRNDLWIAVFAAVGGASFAAVGIVADSPALTWAAASVAGAGLGWVLLRSAILSALRQARSEE